MHPGSWGVPIPESEALRELADSMRGVAPGPCAISAVRGFAHVKDKLENKLHKPLCAGTIPLDQAQHEIATDRVAAAVTYGVIEPTNSDTAR